MESLAGFRSVRALLGANEKPWQLPGNEKITHGTKKREVVLSAEDPEMKFVDAMFSLNPPTNRRIAKVRRIIDSSALFNFEFAVADIAREALEPSSAPFWVANGRVEDRQLVYSRWRSLAEAMSPNPTISFPGYCVLPLWTRAEEGDSLIKPFSNRTYFGSGTYFTTSARFAADVYCSNQLVLAWVAMRTPFPIVGALQTDTGALCEDIEMLKNKQAYQNYSAHHAAMVPINPLEQSSVHVPCPPGVTPACDEIVVFKQHHALPCFVVDLEPSIQPRVSPSLASVSSTSSLPAVLQSVPASSGSLPSSTTVDDLHAALVAIMDNEHAQLDDALMRAVEAHLDATMMTTTATSSSLLSPDASVILRVARSVIDDQGRIRPYFKRKLIEAKPI